MSFDDGAFSVRRLAPVHGAHTDEVLAELGYGAADLSALEGKGVIKRPARVVARDSEENGNAGGGQNAAV